MQHLRWFSSSISQPGLEFQAPSPKTDVMSFCSPKLPPPPRLAVVSVVYEATRSQVFEVKSVHEKCATLRRHRLDLPSHLCVVGAEQSPGLCFLSSFICHQRILSLLFLMRLFCKKIKCNSVLSATSCNRILFHVCWVLDSEPMRAKHTLYNELRPTPKYW